MDSWELWNSRSWEDSDSYENTLPLPDKWWIHWKPALRCEREVDVSASASWEWSASLEYSSAKKSRKSKSSKSKSVSKSGSGSKSISASGEVMCHYDPVDLCLRKHGYPMKYMYERDDQDDITDIVVRTPDTPPCPYRVDLIGKLCRFVLCF